jgi:translation elongation factor P/translation initiation factor 5A
VIELHHITPGNKRGHVIAKLRDIRTNRLVDHKFRAEEDVDRAVLDEVEMQFLYRDGEIFHFMNTATYEQVHITQETLGDQALYLLPEALIRVDEMKACRSASSCHDRRSEGVVTCPASRAPRGRPGQARDGRDRAARDVQRSSTWAMSSGSIPKPATISVARLGREMDQPFTYEAGGSR